tara:strand:- start:2477 stop:2998 length:522 start_codon:yes stop_codon:yes gene_type:complete
MTDVMIDLETLDTATSTVILSIGIVNFDPNKGSIDRPGGMLIFPDVQEQINSGRTVSWDTVKWWMEQSEDARSELTKAERMPCEEINSAISAWFMGKRDYRVWGNGAIFDISIMENFLGKGKIPWKFWNVRDTRTFHMNFPYDKSRKTEVAHTALQDAVSQAERICEVWPMLK